MAEFIAPKASELRHKMYVQSLGQKTDDGMGGYTASWVTIATVWARKKAWKGKEILASNQAKSSAFFEVDFRYLKSTHISTAMRLVDANGDNAGRQYDIRFIADPTEEREWLHLSIEAVKQK